MEKMIIIEFSNAYKTHLTGGSHMSFRLSSLDNFLPPLSTERERCLFQKYNTLEQGSEKDKLRGFIIQSNLRLAARFALSHHTQYKLPLEELYGEAKCAIVKAFDAFDPVHNTKFSTYAGFHLKNALKETAKGSQTIRHNLTKKDAEAAGLEDHLNPRMFSFQSFDQEIQGTEGLTLADVFEDPNAVNPLDKAEEISTCVMVSNHLECLPEKDKLILQLYYGIGLEESMSLISISKRLGISKERCRQIKDRAEENLRRSIRRVEE